MSDKIMTLHPDPDKTGVNIDKAKYEAVKEAILAVVAEETETPFKTLADKVAEKLGDSFTGSFGWYTTTVKLDLEARGTIERIPGKSPQMIRTGNQ